MGIQAMDSAADGLPTGLRGVTLLSHYVVGTPLSEGGMGLVYMAKDTDLGVDVVVKVPHRRLLGEPGFRDRFEREIQGLIGLQHPHVVRILARGEHAGIPFFVLQFLAGGSLARRLKDAPQGPGDAARWLPTIAAALDFVHARGIVHRDVKPSNILFDEFDHVYLSDFGIAKTLSVQQSQLTSTGLAIGSPYYMAPEQGMGRDVAGPADQYALAATLYEALSGRPPFDSGTPMEILLKKEMQAPQRLDQVAKNVHPLAAAVVMRGLSQDPRHRFPTCSAFASAFVSASHDGAPEAVSIAPHPPPAASGAPAPGLHGHPRARGPGRQTTRHAAPGSPKDLEAPVGAPDRLGRRTPARALRRPWLSTIGGALILLGAGLWGLKAFELQERASVVQARGERPEALAALFPREGVVSFVGIPNLTRLYLSSQQTIEAMADRMPASLERELREGPDQFAADMFGVPIEGPQDLEHFGLGIGGAGVVILHMGQRILAFRCSQPERYLRAFAAEMERSEGRSDIYERRELQGCSVLAPRYPRAWVPTVVSKGDAMAVVASGGSNDEALEALLDAWSDPIRSLADDSRCRRELDRLRDLPLALCYVNMDEVDDRDARELGLVTVMASVGHDGQAATFEASATLRPGLRLPQYLSPVRHPLLPSVLPEDQMIGLEGAVDWGALVDWWSERSSTADEFRRWVLREAQVDLHPDLIEALSGTIALMVSETGHTRLARDQQSWLRRGLREVPGLGGFPGKVPGAKLAIGLEPRRGGVRAVKRVFEALANEASEVQVRRLRELGEGAWTQRLDLPGDSDEVVPLTVEGTEAFVAVSFEGMGAVEASGLGGTEVMDDPGVLRIVARPRAVAAWLASDARDDDRVRALLGALDPYDALDLVVRRVGERLEARCRLGTAARPGLVARAALGLGGAQWILIGLLFMTGLGWIVLAWRRAARHAR